MKQKVILLIAVAFGLYLRIIRLEELAGFDFDQEKAALWVKAFLVNGKMSLIGQEISTGGIFIGPLYYYILSPFFLILKMNPLAANIMASLVALSSLFVVYKTGQILFGKKTGLLALFLYAVSFRLNFYDRTTAPSMFVMLFSTLTLYSLVKIRSGSPKWIYVIAACLGIGLSIHPTMTVLLPIVAAAIYFSKIKIELKHYLMSAVISLFFISPLLIFELRHHFLNTSGTLKILSGSGFTLTGFAEKISWNWQSLLVSLESLILSSNFGGLGILAVFFIVRRKIKTFDIKMKWLLIWLAAPFILFCFYPRNVPEYYFMLSFPPFVIFFARWLLQIFASKKLILWLLLFSIALINLISLNSYNYLVSMKYKKEAVQYVLRSSGNEKFSVNYWTDQGQKNGFDYLFWFFGREPVQSGIGIRHFVIVVPSQKKVNKPNKIFGNIQVVREKINL